MANTFVASRAHIIWGVCLPLAILLGYLLADPVDQGSLAVLVLLGAVLSVPLVLKWHHPMLILAWNAAIWPWFLPGMMALWMALGMITFVFGVLNRATSPENKFLCPMSVTISLIFIAVVVVGTMLATGGMGMRVLNSGKYGGKGYFFILFAIIGCFALVSQRIPLNRAKLFAGLFFLSGITEVVGDLIYLLRLPAPVAEALFRIFPAVNAVSLAFAEADPGTSGHYRIYGMGLAMLAVVTCLLTLFGLRGLLDFKRPWRAMFLVLAIGAGMLSGFRSLLLLCLMSVVAIFFLEKLHRTRWMFIAAGGALLTVLLLVTFSTELPLSIQRTISFLPVPVDPAVRMDTQGSVNWRLEMWNSLLPDLPQYWFLGKGFLVEAQALNFGIDSLARGFGARWEAAILAGDYHSGPLSLYIPLGGLGVAAFLTFLVAGARVLLLNHRHGPPELATINRFLLAYFLVRIVYFVAVFGSFSQDLHIFTGLLGLSLSLNGGVRRPQPAEVEPEMEPQGLAWSDY